MPTAGSPIDHPPPPPRDGAWRMHAAADPMPVAARFREGARHLLARRA